MDIKNLFVKGWQSDIEPSMQPPNTVRDLLNMRLTDVLNNSYSLETLKGTKFSFSLNPGYFPIGWTRIDDDVVILSTKDMAGTDQNGEVGVVTINADTYIGSYVPYYNHQGLTFNSAHQIECQTYRENRNIGRVYWADNYNTFRALNLFDSRLTTYFTAGTLTSGDSYMVLTDSVTTPLGTFGPNEAAGTVFVYNGTATFNGGPLVIAYIDITLIDVVPARDQGNINFNRWLPNGSLLGGGYQYCYQLYTSDGIETNFSYVSMPFLVPNTVVPTGATVSYQALQGGAITDSSTKGQRIQIDGIDTNFDSIRVVAIHDTSLIATDTPVIFFDGAITSSTMTFDHMGNENLGTLSAADITVLSLSIERVKTLAILKKRMFIGGVQFSKFVEFDRTGVSARTIEYMIPSDTSGRPDASSDAGTAGLSGHGYAAAAGVSSTFTYQWYKVKGNTGVDYVEYPIASGSFYGPGQALGDVFRGVTVNHAFSTFGSPVVNAILHIQKYTGAYRDIEILDDFVDNKGAAVANHVKSNRRGERKRYGFLVYDRFQNPQYVQWILDKDFPHQYDAATGLVTNNRLIEEIDNDYGAGGHACYLRNLGVNFSGINFNLIAANLGVAVADLPNYMGGFSIVRAPEENEVYAQGVLQATVIDGTVTRPLSAPGVANDNYGALSGRRPNCYTFYSPEFEFIFDGGQSNIASGDFLRIEDYYRDAHQAVANAGTTEAADYHLYEKLYAQTSSGSFANKSSENQLDLTQSFTTGVGATHTIGSGITWDNNSATAAFAIFGGNSLQCVGSETFFCKTTYAETGSPYSVATGFVTTNDTKAIVSFRRPNSNLYGGTGASALAATQYIYCGHYQAMDAAFMTYLAGNAGIANDIEVFGGDCYVNLFDVARMISNEGVALRASFGFSFPCESAVNVAMRQGRHLFKDRSLDNTINPGLNQNGISFGPTQQVEQFVYNAAYSYQESQFLYPATPANFVPNAEFERRVYVSPPKVDGEITDNFRIFPINDFIDLEGQGGSLTNLWSDNDMLWYLQRRCAGNLPVNERTTISSGLGLPINIGTGGVLERYDNMETFYGNQHQFGFTKVEGGGVWFDAKRKTMCFLSSGGALRPLSVAGGLRSFFDQIGGNVTGSTFLNSDNPIRNNGIAAAYNARFKEVLFSFRGINPDKIMAPYKPTGITVAFDYLNNQYNGKFSMLPGIMTEINNVLLCAFTGKYGLIAGSTAYAVDDMVSEGTINYVCILAYTSAGTPVQPSVDTTHWTAMGDINEVHVADVGQVCKFFGHVDNNYLQIAVAPGDENEDIVFDNFRANCSPEFFDTATYDNSHQTQTETIAGSDDYAYLNRSWFWSVPLATDEDRFRDHYLLIKLDKNNRSNGNPAISTNKQVKIVSIKTEMRKTL